MTAEIAKQILSNPWALLAVFLFFGASIFVHELGHFLAARWRGLQVDRFSIGFGPRLLGWKDRRGVDWRISLLPLGGYVALPQLADMRGIEGEVPENSRTLPPISYIDKMVVSVAGAVFNVIFALFLASILWVIGIPVEASSQSTRIGYILTEQTLSNGDTVPSAAAEAGLLPGDRILSIDGDPVRDWEEVFRHILAGARRDPLGRPLAVLEVERDGEKITVETRPRLVGDEGIRALGIARSGELKVKRVFPGSPAETAGLQPGDAIVQANGEPLFSPAALSTLIARAPSDALSIDVRRGEQKITLEVAPQEVVVDESGRKRPMIGIEWDVAYVQRHVDPFSQITQSATTTLQVLGALLNPRSDIGLRNLSGPVGISYAIYLTSLMGISVVLSLIVLINVNLAILNLLPVPVLDGGHMAFATIQKIRGKPLPPNLIATTQGAFMLLLFSMVIYVSFFDVQRVASNEKARFENIKAEAEAVTPEFASDPEE
jgi:regulator of sigma E protease